MSFFYLTAVKGDMPIHLMETIIVKRLEYLQAVIKGDGIVYNEYVVEGSVYDNVGHFMLCIVSILGENTEFLQFIFRSELELFKRRLAYLAAYDIRSFAKKLIRTIRKQESIPSHIEALNVLCQHLMLKDLAQHICAQHNNDCNRHKLHLNFRHCLHFVAKREVELKNGIAALPCGKWKKYLTLLYATNLKQRLDNTDLIMLKSDPRVMEVLQKIRQDYFPHISKSTSVLLSREVDKVSQRFPPCMLNLHLTLRKKHRLSHSQRFYYSLFLKDIGMPVEEAVYFWSAEYRQNPSGSHSCCHSWEKDEKKYLYGIRHMYGLEGGRKNYTSGNCQRIQSTDNACSEGGCPFKSFDHSKMLPLLHNPSEQVLSQILEYKQNNQYTKSCMLYLKSLNETVNCDNFSFNFSPVKYYAIASNMYIK